MNVYKPLPAAFCDLPVFPHPSIYSGDFNSQHRAWGYKQSTPNGEALSDWASRADLTLLYSNKYHPSFYLHRWNSGTNPDLAFTTSDSSDIKQMPTRTVLGRFTRSQHRPSIIVHPALITPTPTKPVSRWNFRKANWEAFKRDSETVVNNVAHPTKNTINECYNSFTKSILVLAKKHTPRGFRKTYIPGWDEECDYLAKS